MSLHESPFDRDQDSVPRRSPSSRENFSRRPAEGTPPTGESDRDRRESEESTPGDAADRAVSDLAPADRAAAPPLSSSGSDEGPSSDEESPAAARLSLDRGGSSRVTTPDHEMLSRLGRSRSSGGSPVSTGSLAEFAFRGGLRSEESDDAPARDPACDQPSGYLARPR